MSSLHRLSILVRPLLLGALLLPPLASAQDAVAGGAVPPALGDLYLFSSAYQGSSSSDSALARYDQTTGLGGLFVDTFSTFQHPQAAAYDPGRAGIVFVAGLVDVFQPTHLWLVDGAGTLTDLGLQSTDFWCLTPVPDGKIYGRVTFSNAGRVWYTTGDGQLQELLDESGTQPFTFEPGGFFQFNELAYHAPTRSLVAVGGSGLSTACGGGGQATGMVFKRVTLSADGTRAVGPILCGEFEVSTSGETPVGIDHLPDGDLLVVVDTNSNAAEPRMIRIHPETMTASPFATNGSYVGAAATNAGCWSNVLGEGLILDTFEDDVRAFPEGTSGAGTLLGLSPSTGPSGGTGENATLLEIDALPCDGAWVGFGDGLAGTGGFEPVLNGTGCPLPGETVFLHVTGARGGTQAALFLGVAPAALPFKGGTLYLLPAITLPFTTNGSPGAAGAADLTLPFPLPPDPGLSGASLYLQGAFGDPAAPANVSLTAGLQMLFG